VELRSLTAGRGEFEAEHDHYDVLSDHLISRVVPTAAGAAAGR
jgi:elongation factor G